MSKCEICGKPIAEELSLCKSCAAAVGKEREKIKITDELRDIAGVLNLTANTDKNIKESMESLLRIADRLEVL